MAQERITADEWRAILQRAADQPADTHRQALQNLIHEAGLDGRWRRPFPQDDPREALRLEYLEARLHDGLPVPDDCWGPPGIERGVLRTEIRLPDGRTTYVWEIPGEEIRTTTRPVAAGMRETVTFRNLNRDRARAGRAGLALMRVVHWSKCPNLEKARRAVVGALYLYREYVVSPAELRGTRCTYERLAARFKLSEDQVRYAVRFVRKLEQKTVRPKSTLA